MHISPTLSGPRASDIQRMATLATLLEDTEKDEWRRLMNDIWDRACAKPVSVRPPCHRALPLVAECSTSMLGLQV